MSRRRNRQAALQWAVRAELAKAAPDFEQTMIGAGSGRGVSPALQAKINRDFGASGTQTAQFGPGVPMAPQVLDNTGEPRQWEYRTGWNLPSQPGEGRPLSMSTLRDLADTYDLLRKGIEIRKDELCTMRLDFVARDTDRKRARQVIADQQEKIRELRAFFAYPDKENSWQSWLRMILEDHFVLDATTIWKWKTLGGKLWALRPLDGGTIKPLLSIQGTRPKAPDPAYQQFLLGVVRWSFTADELIYAPKAQSTNSVYGQSCVEMFILHVNQALRFQRFQTDYFTDGTIPEGVAEAPASWTPKQLEEFNLYWDRLLSGDSRQLRKLQFVPAGFKWHEFKPYSFNLDFARWLVSMTAAALDLTPTELGFEPMHGGLGGKGFSEEQGKVLERKANGPLRRWVCDEILNPVIWNDFGAHDLQAVLLPPNEEDEALSEAQSIDLDIRNGRRSIDQIVEEEGGEPPGIGRIFVVGNTIYGEPDLITLTKEGSAALAGQTAKATAAALPTPAAPAKAAGEIAGAASVQQGTQSTTQAKTEGKESASSTVATKSALADEVGRFVRFAGERQAIGKWRDFRSDVIPTPLLGELNKAAKAGASAEELRSLVGLEEQPKAYRDSVARTERAYRGLTTKLAEKMGELVEAHA